MEHDYRRRVPLESVVIAFLLGWAWVVALCLLLLFAALIREAFRRKPARRSPFYTPALTRALGER